ncbi:MAG: glycosyltransferase family 4 protein [Pseudomonadales bacterium]|jgi:glycosyltransferase involved in cell wall biosynthesis|nr:glycosyltransferase family 4 protein [Pseudomonadales bacterium]
MKSQTILHVIDTTGPGGAETVFIELADRLRQRGYRCLVLIRGPGWVCEQLRARGFEPFIVDAKGSFNWRFLRELLRIVRRERVDVIQSHLLGSNVYCAMAGLLARKPVIATFHGMVDVGPGERFRGAKLWLMNRGVSRFVAVSSALRTAIDREGLLDPARCEIIYNGVDMGRYGRGNGASLRQRLGLAADAVLVGSLGNVRPAKGYDLLIRAAREVVAQRPDVHFIIAGDPKTSLQRQLDALAQELKIADHIHFIGFCNDSAAYLAQLDLFLLTSTSEGLSIATIEALATGLPAVVTRCGGPEEIMQADRDGLMVEPQAPAIAAGLLRLLNDAALGERLAAQGRSHVREHFSIEAMLDAYCRLYESPQR